ncbi:MAG: efflux RND transporter periplasmic adaptor subunit [Bacteroides sp.]|nr:efflux RND transporter periplasmic adaptor subunit [Bacteroides sp.]
MNHKTPKNIRNSAVLLTVGIGLLWVCGKFVHLGNVEYTDNAQVHRNLVPINSRVQGFIQEVCFDDYQEVKKGDTLVIIENSEFRLKVAQARTNHQKALVENTAMGTVISTTDNNIHVTDAAIEELRIRMELAEKEYHRYEQLYAQKAVTRQQYDNMKADYEAKKAKYDMQVRQKRSTSLVKEEQTQWLEQNRSSIEVAEASLHLAELNLSYTYILAPCDGVTSRKAIQEGQLVQPGQTLLSLVESDRVWVIANYKETQTANIREGMPVEIAVDAVPDIRYYGFVKQISNATGAQFSVVPQDNSAGNFVKVEQRIPLKIVFDSRNTKEDLELLRSGMNVECEAMYSDLVPLVVFTSFVCGAFKMVGTFICWSNIQLNITPHTRLCRILSPPFHLRAATVRHPFIRLETFVQPGMLNIFILFGGMTLMSTTSGGLQNIYTGSILHYDMYHNITLNWGSFVGVLAGAGFSYLGLVKWYWRNKSVVFVGFVCFTLYQLMLYFLIDASTDKYMLYLPMFLKGAGLCIVYTVLTYTLAVSVPFAYYFEAMCVIGFIRTSFGNPLSAAVVTRAFNCIKQKNLALLSSEHDAMNPLTADFSSLYSEVQRQVTLVSLKEVYGLAALAGVMILLLILLSDYREHFKPRMPKMVAVWKMVRKEVEVIVP